MSMRLIATTLMTLSANASARAIPGKTRRFPALMLLVCWMPVAIWNLAAAEPDEHFNVRNYAVGGNVHLDASTLAAIFSRHTGTDIDLKEIVRAAAELQSENRRQGHPEISVAIMPEQITNGIVTLNVFQAAYPQIVVSGRRYLDSGEMAEEAVTIPSFTAPSLSSKQPAATAVTNAIPSAPIVPHPLLPASPEEQVKARAALLQKLAGLDANGNDTRIHVVSTNAGPRFEVEKYQVMGNSVLTPKIIGMTLTNIDGAFGTNVSFEGIRTAVTQLQGAYSERGYVTVSVGLPQQKLTNATVKVQVTEGRLADILVKGNRYFSSNNVVRALPGLHTGMILNGPIFNAELNRANASQDRQIYPVIGPGPDPGTSDLTLMVKDQFPLHAKVELDNESSPGTPDLRINSSAVYDNVWGLNHSLGLQYGFSPQQFKDGDWPIYDGPLVANYGLFYRLPLGNPKSIDDMVASKPGSFGYDEATHKINLPPPTGQPDMTVFASRSTIDTGLLSLSFTPVATTPGGLSISQQNVQQDVTVNQDIGARWSVPMVTPDNVQLNFSGGLDYKTYQVSSDKTNLFQFNQVAYNAFSGLPTSTNSSTIPSPVPATVRQMQYLPLSLRSDADWRDSLGTTAVGLGLSINPWYASQSYINGVATATGNNSLQGITGSPKSTGFWAVLTPTYTRTFMFLTNWITSFHADGQWASEPLISNEQFGIGGVNSVRGYHEGESFGDTGFHLSLEQHTPTHVVGMVRGNTPLTLSGSIYMDYASVYLLDPQGFPSNTRLWGTGFGIAAALGSHWQASFLFSLPLISTTVTPRNEPYFNFSMTAQF
jgi:hemolysin activation/secretion protein